MRLENRTIQQSLNFNDALHSIERSNGTDKTVTSSRNLDNICDTLKVCTDVATFNKNVKREVGQLNSDQDTTELLTVLDGVHLDNSRRSATNARSTLANKCNESIAENGSLATYKVARNHYQAQRLRNETVARTVCRLVSAECQPGEVARNTDYSATYVDGSYGGYVDSYAIVGNDERCNVTFKSNPGKDVRNALKAAGFKASTTSCIMYCDTDGRSFDEIATLVINTITAVDRKNRRDLDRRIRNASRVLASLAN